VVSRGEVIGISIIRSDDPRCGESTEALLLPRDSLRKLSKAFSTAVLLGDMAEESLCTLVWWLSVEGTSAPERKRWESFGTVLEEFGRDEAEGGSR